MDVELADWILAVVSFVTGTAVPVIYRRLSYEGVSLRQPFDVRGVFQDSDNRERNEFVFSTIVKVVNAKEASLIIDEIEVDSVSGESATFSLIGVDLRTSEPGEGFHIPPHTAPNAELDYLPLLVKGNTERLITVGLWFRYSTTRSASVEPKDEFMDLASGPGIRVRFRINGKYRSYLLHAKPFDRWKEA